VDRHADGLILPLQLFGEGIDFLLRDGAAARALGAAGHAHWEACYTWDVVGPRYVRMLRGDGVTDLHAPSASLAETDRVRSRFYDARVRPAVSQRAAA
jgi:hypothetical protein